MGVHEDNMAHLASVPGAMEEYDRISGLTYEQMCGEIFGTTGADVEAQIAALSVLEAFAARRNDGWLGRFQCWLFRRQERAAQAALVEG